MTEDNRQFFAIDVCTLRLDSAPDFELYLLNERQDSYVLYRARDTHFGETDLRRLIENDVRTLFVPVAERTRRQTYLESNLGQILADERVSTPDKSRVVYQSASGLVRELLESPAAGEHLRRSSRLVGNLVKFILDDRSALATLVSISALDYEVYTHSVNVCTYGLALARHVGMHDVGNLAELGVGLLLHDCGKTRIPKAILHKTERLTPVEWAVLKQHPTLGYEFLKSTGRAPARSLEIVLYHHENANGSGYPRGLSLNQIPPWAMMCRLADTYDALTTRRTYRPALPPYKGLQTMCAAMANQLDSELLGQFIVLLGPRKEAECSKA